jgi:hypothetical protein
MIFAPFTGVNHRMQNVFFGAIFLTNENIAGNKHNLTGMTPCTKQLNTSPICTENSTTSQDKNASSADSFDCIVQALHHMHIQ